MAGLVVIRLVPEKPVDAVTFQGYLSGLTIQAFDLTFETVDADPPGTSVGTAAVAPISPAGVANSLGAPSYPTYVAGTNGIVQQFDFTLIGLLYEIESVAIAVISITSAATSGNFRLDVQRGGQTLVSVPYQYSRSLDPVAVPDPATLVSGSNPFAQISAWAALSVDTYIAIPATTTSELLALPKDGKPPAFDALLTAVNTVIASDPGPLAALTTTAPAAPAGSDSVTVSSAGEATVGMTISGAGVPPGTTVVDIQGNTITLSQELTAVVNPGANLTLAVNLAALSVAQCRNIAYEIVWEQQPPLPAPPDAVEELYTNPPNSGVMLSGSTPNTVEGDRQQFEGQLQSYYAVADTTADALTSYVYALSAAIACEQWSIAATEAMLRFPPSAGVVGASTTKVEVILAGVHDAGVTGGFSFGVPAAYFYALGAAMPAQITPAQRYARATGDQLERLLTDLTTAVNAGTITDSESCVGNPAVTASAAQAARRIDALGVPPGSSTPLAPLGTVASATTVDAPSGSNITVADATGIAANMMVSGPGIAPGTTVQALAGNVVTLTPAPAIRNDIPAGTVVIFTPAYTAHLNTLVTDWLAFPPPTSGPISSEIYQPSDDAAKFWPTVAGGTTADAFLELVLAAVTEAYVLAPPFNDALGTEIENYLKTLPGAPATPTAATLASVTAAQWTQFFQQNPTWLPPFTAPGNTSARIAAFIAAVQTMFAVGSGGPSTAILRVTMIAASGATLTFASNAGILVGMAVSGPPGGPIAAGTTVNTIPAGGTKVTISPPLTGTLPKGSTVTFTPTVTPTAAPDAPPLLATTTTDWLTQCLNAYGAFTLGNGFNVANLQAAAATVFPDDDEAQAWLVDALVAIDVLCQVIKQMGGVTVTPPTPITFSVIEALYARGFRSAAEITQLDAADFAQALLGTVAYDVNAGDAIYNAAAALAPPQTSPATSDAFAPVNADGELTDCIPAPCASPLGPIEYLHELLGLSELSTTESLTAPAISLTTTAAAAAGATLLTFATTTGLLVGMSASGGTVAADTIVTARTATTVTLSQSLTGAQPAGTAIQFDAPTLGDVVAGRRGPLGDLLASCANLETPLPLVDLVNECLEYLGAAATPAGGTVYDTAEDNLAGHVLCVEKPCPDDEDDKSCHEPARLFAALPEYSTPATPVAANVAVEPAVWDNVKADLSSCLLPYSQALDVSRTYLRQLGSCRYEEMRTFRKCITEFVLDPANEPAGFESWLWRYPVRIDTAIEYLGITPEEYTGIFGGAQAPPCAGGANGNGNGGDGNGNGGDGNGNGPPALAEVAAAAEGRLSVPVFLELTCLTYCEFYELWQSGFVEFGNGADEDGGEFPQCESCCLDELWLEFPEEEQVLPQLLVFVRLWRKLRESCCFCYTFAQLRDICDVLGLYAGATLNPDFIRELAAFQLLRDDFGLELVDDDDPPGPTDVDADRTHLLALWVGSGAAKWEWSVGQLLEGIERHAHRRHAMDRRRPEPERLREANLDPLSRLAGFDPGSATDSWHALPTHTLRFAEVLAKIYASDFSVGELIYLFTALEHLQGDDPFPLQDDIEALDLPLGLPDDDRTHSLWRLRRELLRVEIEEEEEEHEHWPWRRVEAALRNEFGFDPAAVLALGQHFFPTILGEAGQPVSPAATRFVTSLSAANTSAAMWDHPPDGPFYYDSTSQQLSTALPLHDRAIIRKLAHVYDLDPAERQAVQDLVFQPRAMLAEFALLFEDFSRAQRRLIEEPNERERFAYFRRQFMLCRHRCLVIAQHLTRHVAATTRQEAPDDPSAALLILHSLDADENAAATSWENDSGAPPALTWTPPPLGSALAALLGLTGTGLLAEYQTPDGTTAWRDASESPGRFGHQREHENCPVPTVLPAFDTALTPQQLAFASVHNGLLMNDATGEWLGGAQGFSVTWSGALLIEQDGTYEFWAGAPAEDDDCPDPDAAWHRQWRVTLERGQRETVILSHHWNGEGERRSASLPLKRGAYELTVEFRQPPPDFDDADDLRHQHTGVQIKYCGPDTDGHRIQLPHSHLFLRSKDDTLGNGITVLSAGADAYLGSVYLSSLRDVRRTYQRAYKALLFAHRFRLSAERRPHGTSELGYMLNDLGGFAGSAFYRSGGAFTRHAADFDFDFLPVLDTYLAPPGDARANPTAQRTQAMFDWWERIFDYTMARAEVRRRCDRHLWHLFEEAADKQPADPGSLLRHMGADSRHWTLDLHYFQRPGVGVYAVSSADLTDERWVLRAWHADRWLHALECCFAPGPITEARPDLWAADDPSGGPLPGETETGNANLSRFVCDGCLETGEPRRYDALKRLNDALRERGRDALIAYLCHMDRVPLPWRAGAFATTARDVSDLLLLDVEAGIPERASRIDEAITAVQSYVRRARLGLEPGWTVTPAFARLWDREFTTFHVWQACKRRQLYKENWIEWDELEKARRFEAFRFLEDRLCADQLTVAAPGDFAAWWPDERPPTHECLELLQSAELSHLAERDKPREGLNLLGSPQRSARPSWLAQVPPVQLPGNGRGNGDGIGGPATSFNAAPEGAELPYWLRVAVGLGTRFWRIDAAGLPPAGNSLAPYPHPDPEDCVTCCEDCGCHERAVVDEYWFWLVDGAKYDPPTTPAPTGFTATPGDYRDGYQTDFYDPGQQEAALWEDPSQLPQLLEWEGSPTVRLAWCRVHNGEFQQPRRSIFALEVTPKPGAELDFLGRTGDSLIFSMPNGIAPDGYADTSAPGFRYDIATDEAVVLPQASAWPTPGSFLLGSLPAYPYFVFFAPGTPLFPLSPFAPAIEVARALRSHCQFEAALRWYRLAFDPLNSDCTWIKCDERRARDARHEGGACCDSTDIDCAQARARSILLHYLETLIEWTDALRRRGNDPEAFLQARVMLDTVRMILGPRPRAVRLPPPPSPPTVTNFVAAFPPLNSRLLDIFDTVDDRLALIHAVVNAERRRQGAKVPYFGNSPLIEGWRDAEDTCAEWCDWCELPSPYRFTFLIAKAVDYVTRAEQLGGALLAAFEKGDAEYLATLRVGQELEVVELGLEARKDQWRDADWQVQALQTGKSVHQSNLNYTNSLINAAPGGLINGEIQYQNHTNSALALRGTGNVIEGVGEALRFIPDIVLGAAGFGGSPVAISWIPLGTKIGDALEAVARIINNSGEIETMTGGLDQTNASWLRRLIDWQHQTQVLALQIRQSEREILGAQRRRDQALRDLNTHRRQIEQAREIKEFVRDKFTAHDLYLYLQEETLRLYRSTYDLALRAARQAQHAFNLERGHTSRHLVRDCGWDTLREGLLAGERLSASLRHMEKAYLDENVREYELTKHFSLRLHFPLEYVRLRTTGRCEIEIPEWMYDLETPGMYMRRIKSVSLTLPCVTGPYTGVHSRLTLIDSTTRIDPSLRPPAHECCCPPEPCDCDCGGDCDCRRARDYELCPDDPRAVRQYDAREAIATSTGQSDPGVFELNFDDPRYLPFEYRGAISRCRLELSQENNFFDRDTLTDVVMRLNYTAREGGERLRAAANTSAQCHLPGDGWRFFELRHDFPDAWQRLRLGDDERDCHDDHHDDDRHEHHEHRHEHHEHQHEHHEHQHEHHEHQHEHHEHQHEHHEHQHEHHEHQHEHHEHHEHHDDDRHPRHDRHIRLRLTRSMFPFIPGGRELWIEQMALVFEARRARLCTCPEHESCPCQPPCRPAAHEVEVSFDYDRNCGDADVRCVAGDEWPRTYCGVFDVRLGPVGEDGRRAECEFHFPAATGPLERVFLLCRYRTHAECRG